MEHKRYNLVSVEFTLFRLFPQKVSGYFTLLVRNLDPNVTGAKRRIPMTARRFAPVTQPTLKRLIYKVLFLF